MTVHITEARRKAAERVEGADVVYGVALNVLTQTLAAHRKGSLGFDLERVMEANRRVEQAGIELDHAVKNRRRVQAEWSNAQAHAAAIMIKE